ncbi:MAG TPA: hypothetical protein VKA44_06795, partial [Gemmatimonadota bacterium]|nr:hypothetical protein [Gemmatimonadota bacterium]
MRVVREVEREGYGVGAGWAPSAGDAGARPDENAAAERSESVPAGTSGTEAGRGALAAAPDPDAVGALGDEICTLAAHMHAGRQKLLTLLARFDRLGGWEAGGHRSCAHWLAFRTGMDLHTAREHV